MEPFKSTGIFLNSEIQRMRGILHEKDSPLLALKVGGGAWDKECRQLLPAEQSGPPTNSLRGNTYFSTTITRDWIFPITWMNFKVILSESFQRRTQFAWQLDFRLRMGEFWPGPEILSLSHCAWTQYTSVVLDTKFEIICHTAIEN